MHKVEHSTATAESKFTDGNPVTGVPSTRVPAKWLNSIQGELVNLVESCNIVLESDPANSNFDKQVTQAVHHIANNNSSSSKIIANNTAVWTTIDGLVFNKLATKSSLTVLDIYRKTATVELSSIFTLKPVYFPIQDKWRLLISEESPGELSGVEFNINEDTGVVSYKSSNLTGGSYEGLARYKTMNITI